MNDVNTAYSAETISAATAAIATKSLEQTVAGLTDGLARASTGAEQTQAKLKEGTQAAMKQAEEIIRFGQANIEALIKSTQIWVNGVLDLSKQAVASVQACTQETMNVFQTLGTVKSIREAIDLQSRSTRNSLEIMLSEGGRLTQASVKLSQQALEPITERARITGVTLGKIA